MLECCSCVSDNMKRETCEHKAERVRGERGAFGLGIASGFCSDEVSIWDNEYGDRM